MSDFAAYFYIGLGVLVAVLYPVIVGAWKRQFGITKGVPPWLIKYAVLLVFCAFTAFIVLVVYRASHPDTELHFYTAVMLGFGWESSVEKISDPIWGGKGAASATATGGTTSPSPSAGNTGQNPTRS